MATARGLFGSPGSIGQHNTITRVWEVGKAAWMYPTITDAIAAVNAATNPPSATNRGMIYVHPGKYTSTAAYVIPTYTGVKGASRGLVQLENSTTDMFQVGTGGHVWFEDLLIEGSTNSALYAFDCNDQSACHFTRVDMFDQGGTARQMFLKQEGANWSVLKLEHCDVDFNGLSGYACRIYNTSGSARMVDTWIKDCFFDAFALGASGGGCFDLSKLRDIRFWHNVVRGTNTADTGVFRFTGIRVRNGGSTGITCEIGNHYGVGVEGGSGGIACFGDANTTIDLYSGVARGAGSSGTLNNRGNLTYVTQ